MKIHKVGKRLLAGDGAFSAGLARLESENFLMAKLPKFFWAMPGAERFVLYFAVDEACVERIKSAINSDGQSPPIYQDSRAVHGPGTIELFWRNKISRECLVGALQFHLRKADSSMIVTHMSVKRPFRRQGVNSFMLEVAKRSFDPEVKSVLFYGLTVDGEKFMKAWGGEEYVGRVTP